MKYLAMFTDYGNSLDLIRIGNMRCFTLRWYRDTNWQFRPLSFGQDKYKRFAIDLGHVSFVFENYKSKGKI